MNAFHVLVSLVVITLVVYIAYPCNENKEGFFVTSQNAYVSPVTGAIKGPGIMTDGMTRTNLASLTKQVGETGFAADDSRSLGVSVGSGFDQVYNNQLDIQRIDDKSIGGYQSMADLDTISRKIASSSNNATNNMYTRAGSRPTKMILEPNSIRGIIDEKYLPARDKNYQIATVSTVVPVQGYDINIERIGENLIDTHFSKISRNTKTKRIPTAAGAVGGGILDSTGSANKNILDENISLQGGNIAIKDSLTGETVLAPIDSNAASGYQSQYIRADNSKV